MEKRFDICLLLVKVLQLFDGVQRARAIDGRVSALYRSLAEEKRELQRIAESRAVSEYFQTLIIP